MSQEISTKKTVDEQILERLQALEVVVLEQRKEINLLKEKFQIQEDNVRFMQEEKYA